MSEKLPRPVDPRKSDKETDKPQLSEEDLTVLDDFCENVEFDELDAAAWQELHECLDLTIPLFLGADEAKHGTTKQLSFSRSVREKPGALAVREKDTCEVVIPPGAGDGDQIVYDKRGDRSGGCQGKLKVIIRVKSSS